MIDKLLLSEYSQKYKIDQYTVLREYIQIVFLNYLFQEKGLENLVFKGGTSLRLLYGSPRFSEDLDFNCGLGVNKLKEVLSRVIKQTSAVVPRIQIKDLDTVQGFSSKLYFESDLSTMPLTVKLDFSFREPALEMVKRTISTEMPIQIYSLINVFSAQEILAEKIRTIFQRLKGRDIYDIWVLLNKKVFLDIEMVNKKMEMIGRRFDYKDFVTILSSFEQKQLENDLFKFLPNNQRQIVSNLAELIISDDQVKRLAVII